MSLSEIRIAELVPQAPRTPGNYEEWRQALQGITDMPAIMGMLDVGLELAMREDASVRQEAVRDYLVLANGYRHPNNFRDSGYASRDKYARHQLAECAFVMLCRDIFPSIHGEDPVFSEVIRFFDMRPDNDLVPTGQLYSNVPPRGDVRTMLHAMFARNFWHWSRKDPAEDVLEAYIWLLAHFGELRLMEQELMDRYTKLSPPMVMRTLEEISLSGTNFSSVEEAARLGSPAKKDAARSWMVLRHFYS